MLTDDGYRQLMKHAKRLAQEGHGELAQHLRDAIDLRAEVEALKTNLDDLNADRENLRMFVSKGMHDGALDALQIVKLSADVASLRADAERYRWMRDNKAPELIPFPTEDGRWVAQFFLDGGGIHERTYKTLDAAIDAARAAQGEQADPVEQIGWADEFGNLFPMGAWKPAQRTHHDAHKTAWRPVFLHPPRADAESRSTRAALIELTVECEKSAAENERLRAALDSIRQYGSDTLSGRTDGPDDRKWQRDAVLEMTNRASRALRGE